MFWKVSFSDRLCKERLYLYNDLYLSKLTLINGVNNISQDIKILGELYWFLSFRKVVILATITIGRVSQKISNNIFHESAVLGGLHPHVEVL